MLYLLVTGSENTNSKRLSSTLIPAPRQFNSPSGMAVRFNLMEQTELQEILNKANVQVQSVKEIG
jgi:hypothetical protein